MPKTEELQGLGEVLTISMMRCPHTLHLSAVCWNPEYYQGTQDPGGYVTKGHSAQPAPASWPQVSMGVRRVPAMLHPGTSQCTALTHQEVLLAVHFLAHIVERLPTKPSPCKDEGGERGPWAAGNQGWGPCCHISAPSSNRQEVDYGQTLSFPFNVMLSFY